MDDTNLQNITRDVQEVPPVLFHGVMYSKKIKSLRSHGSFDLSEEKHSKCCRPLTAVFLPGWDNDGIALAPPQARDGFETLLGQEEKAREEHGAGRYDGQHDGCRWTLTILRWKEPSAAVSPVRLTLLQANAANYKQTNDRTAAINAGRAIRRNTRRGKWILLSLNCVA